MFARNQFSCTCPVNTGKKDTFNLKALSVDTSLPLSVVTYLIRHAQYFALDQLESKTSILTYSQFLLPSYSPWVMT
mgnify:CR=1 FL=1